MQVAENDKRYLNEFIQLNEEWISTFFEIEPGDKELAEYPEKIFDDGGYIFTIVEDGEVVVELEEAWAETLTLPGGLAIRMGRFFSSIGYLNQKHFHSWDFADQPMAYQAFLGLPEGTVLDLVLEIHDPSGIPAHAPGNGGQHRNSERNHRRARIGHGPS